MSGETSEQFKERIGVGEPAVGLGRRSGDSHTSVVQRNDGPGVAGSVTEHWDGRRDAVALPETVHVRKNTEIRR